jgi:hypothetical protein
MITLRQAAKIAKEVGKPISYSSLKLACQQGLLPATKKTIRLLKSPNNLEITRWEISKENLVWYLNKLPDGGVGRNKKTATK